MKEEIEQLLPAIKNGELPDAAIEELLTRVHAAIKQDPSTGRELGPMVSAIKAAAEGARAHADLHLFPIEHGYIAIGHKPGGKLGYELLKKRGITAVLTLLQENEGAMQIGQAVTRAGLQWIWFPFSASKAAETDKGQIRELFEKLKMLLNARNGIYIHCSAGIHRTGMIANALLRYAGKTKTDARQILQELREVTAAQVGDERLDWGDQFAQ